MRLNEAGQRVQRGGHTLFAKPYAEVIILRGDDVGEAVCWLDPDPSLSKLCMGGEMPWGWMGVS